ncbi:hypothetical protein K4F52_003328 [Lecanicillium sp. MT-2017a]|nr:hypothetical protein K4F52_003328 [Lecanicillium sp. MT-2017a]
MPSLYPIRGDAPALRRFRELFRKKRDGDEPEAIRELLQQDRGDLLRDIEQILEAGKTTENLPLPTELRTAASYRSTATQTDWPEEVQLSSSRGPKESPVATGIYASSSTQVDLLKGVEENRSPPSAQPPDRDFVSQKASPAIDSTWPSRHAPFIFGKDCKVAEDIQSPRIMFSPSLHQTKCEQALSPQIAPSKTELPPKRIVLAQRQTCRVDDKTGTISLSKMIRLSWKDKFVTIRLPPESFQVAGLSNTGAAKQETKLTPPNAVAHGILRKRPMPQDIEDADDEDSDEGGDNDNRADANLADLKGFNPAIYKGTVYHF